MNYWFKPKKFWGGFAFYMPTSLGGWIITLTLFAIGVAIFVFVDSESHSGSDMLINFAPWVVILMLIFDISCFRLGEYPSWWKNIK